MGMITTVWLEAGTCFGPLPTDWMIADPTYLVAQTTTDILPELPTVMVDPQKLSDPVRLIEWVCNIRSARYPQEQNVELIRLASTGQTFYHCSRRIEAGEELFVWFRRIDLNPLVGYLLEEKTGNVLRAWIACDENQAMPKFDANNKRNSEMTDPFRCLLCGTKFRYIYPYISHCLFKCTTRSKDISKSEFPIHPKLRLDLEESFSSNNSSCPTLDSGVVSQSHLDIASPKRREFEVEQIFPCIKTSEQSYQQNLQKVILEKYISQGHMTANWNPKEANIPDVNTIFPRSSEKTPMNLSNTGEVFKNKKNLKAVDFSSGTHHPPKHPPHLKYGKTVGSSSSSPHKSQQLSPRAVNPLVEQLFQTIHRRKNVPEIKVSAFETPMMLELAQNWCARCSMTFRLTSDLVQHMRTHHNNINTNLTHKSRTKSQKNNKNQSTTEEYGEKRRNVTKRLEKDTMIKESMTVIEMEMDPTDAAMDMRSNSTHSDSVTCHLCGEIFRERHHLTRHMTSHN